MKKLAFIILFIGISSCEKNQISVSIESKVVGTFNTNILLDLSCALLPPDKMPSALIKKNMLNELSITISKYVYIQNEYTKVVKEYKPIILTEDKRGVVLNYKDKEFGYFGIPLSYTGPKMNPRLWIKYEEEKEAVWFVGEKNKKQ